MSDAERYVDEVKRIVLAGLAGRRARVYFFGSRARGDNQTYSDVDVAIEPLEPIPPSAWADLEEALENSTVPYSVDLVNFERASSKLRRRIEQEGILWND